MKWEPDRYRRLRDLIWGARPEAEVQEEFECHLAERTQSLQAAGMSEADARAAALLRFGDVSRFQRETIAIDDSVLRERKRMELLDSFRREVRQALRGLARSPGFGITVVVTLALGIGASTAVYTMLDAVVLNPLPYPRADRLVQVEHAVPGVQAGATWGMSSATYFDYKSGSRSLADLAVYRSSDVNLRIDREAVQGRGVRSSGNLFSVLGARPAAGRLFLPSDDVPGAPVVAVISYEYWERSFGRNPNAIGKTLLLEGYSVEIVGVAEKGFKLPGQSSDVFTPMRLNPAGPHYNDHGLAAIGRMEEGVTGRSVQTELQQLARELPTRHPRVYWQGFMTQTQFSPQVIDLRSALVGDITQALWILFGSVAVVLLIACVNVANLFLVRAEARQNELAVRSALGADRSHVLVQSLSEAVVPVLLAGTLGVWLAYAGLRALVAASPVGLPRLDEVRLSSSTLLFALAVSVGAWLVFSLFPLMRLRVDYSPLREAARGLTASRAQLRVRSALVATQVALAVVLLSAAGLMLRSFQRMRSVELGIDPRNVLAVDVSLPSSQYDTHEAATRFWRELSDRLRTLPGVAHVGSARTMPLADGLGCAVLRARPEPAVSTDCVPTEVVTPGYFEALGIRVRGRVPTWQDIDAGTGAIVITRALAERLWPREDAIGKGIRVPNRGDAFYSIVGVAEDLRAEGVNKPATQMVFYPVKPIEGAPLWQPRNSMTLILRSTNELPERLVSSVRRIANEIEPSAAIGEVRTAAQIVANSMARTSFTMVLLGTAGVMALIISLVGLYGLLAYTVNRRRTELGIRLALGAGSGEVSGMIVMQSIRLAAIGVAVGLVAAFLTTQMLRSLLFEIEPTDAVTLSAVSFLLLAVAALASFLPARRAATVSPVEALRAQ